MPQGKGTYGTKRGRPSKKLEGEVENGKVKIYKKSKSTKYVDKMERKGKRVNPDKLARKQRTDEAKEKFKGGQILKKMKFKRKAKKAYKKSWEEGSWE